jgi:4-aminobutyrate aminotransferase
LWDVDGNKYLDFTAGLGVCNLGHCHPRVTKAVCEQAATLTHLQVNIAWHDKYLALVQKLLEVVPQGLDCVMLSNSGAEAVECALKLARHATGRNNVIVMQGGYHGRTNATSALTTSKNVYSVGTHPLMSGVYVLPFPYKTQLGGFVAADNLIDFSLNAFDNLLKQQTAASDTAALFIEPVLGEGGYVPCPPGFLKALKARCEKHGILLVADEVQTGFGRTGKLFAVEHFGVTPDILITAKGLANGYVLSGLVSRLDLMKAQPPGSMGGTYTGNVVSCAAALAVLEAFKEEKILANVEARSQQLTSGLRNLVKKHSLPVKEIRGLGLMIGLEFDSKECKPGVAARFSKACEKNKLLLLSTSVFETARFIPPLNISATEVDVGLEIFDKAFREIL